MRFHLFLLFFFSHHLFTLITSAYFTNNYDYLNKTNSSINVDLYQCTTNATTFNSTTKTTIDIISNNLLNLCNISCCTSNDLNKTSIYIEIIFKISFHSIFLASSNICQVTVQSSTGICLGRLCYSDKCENFALLANITHDYNIKNKTTIMNQISSSFPYIRWSSLVNSTQTKWTSWIDKTGLTIHDTIIIILFITNISLTFVALIVVIKSIRHANIIANEKSYRYTLL